MKTLRICLVFYLCGYCMGCGLTIPAHPMTPEIEKVNRTLANHTVKIFENDTSYFSAKFLAVYPDTLFVYKDGSGFKAIPTKNLTRVEYNDRLRGLILGFMSGIGFSTPFFVNKSEGGHPDFTGLIAMVNLLLFGLVGLAVGSKTTIDFTETEKK